MTLFYPSRIVNKSVSLLAAYTCQRWSIIIPLIIYLTLFGIVKLASIPLRSNLKEMSVTQRNRAKDYVDRQVKIPETNLIDPHTLLETIFKRADLNQDNFLSTMELASWINNKTQEHIHQAMIENYGIFTAIDKDPRNGVISWNEYHQYFLTQHGFSDSFVNSHDKKHQELSRDLREAIMRDKASWTEAARSNPDHLTVDEFLAFRHPESSHATILALVEDLIDKFDRDGDDALTEEEFSSLQKDDDTVPANAISPVEAERRREFRESVDVSKDGKASRHELLMYIDPKNPRHGKEEAETLFILADADHDGRLSLSEIYNKMDLFLGSKMVDTARSFHDEF